MAQDDFWSFANQLYGEQEVAETCLWLQDKQGADVLMLLFCLWLGLRQGAVPDDTITALDRAATPWRQHVVLPLRATRRWLIQQRGAANHDLRAAVAAAELCAEQHQGQLLTEALAELPAPPRAPGADAARANLERYCALAGAARGAELLAHLKLLTARAARVPLDG